MINLPVLLIYWQNSSSAYTRLHLTRWGDFEAFFAPQGRHVESMGEIDYLTPNFTPARI